MGRIPYKNDNLPPRMRARTQRSGTIYYYYDLGGKPRREQPLGSDYIEAIRKWSALERERAPKETLGLVTFKKVAKRYITAIIPTKAQRTQKDNMRELEFLYEYFEDAPLSEIQPHFIKLYFTWRKEKSLEYYAKHPKLKTSDNPGHVRANREIALFSHIFNFARETGLTNLPNPCAGIKKNTETGRDVYVENDMYRKVWNKADQPTRDAMDLVYLSGQRPADVMKMDERDIKDGFLWIGQGKTGQKLRMAVVGELADVIERIRTRKRLYTVVSTRLVVNEHGAAISHGVIEDRFYDARKAAGVPMNEFQLRDLRAKAGTDTTEMSGDIRTAQKQLGHKSVTMTETYVRARMGDKVNPTR